MGNIEKKINLNVISNLKTHLDTFKELNKTIEQQQKLLTKAWESGNKKLGVYQHNLLNLKKIQDSYRKSLENTTVEAAKLAKQFKDYDKIGGQLKKSFGTIKQIFSGDVLGGISSGIKNSIESVINKQAERKTALIDARIFSLRSNIEDINKAEEDELREPQKQLTKAKRILGRKPHDQKAAINKEIYSEQIKEIKAKYANARNIEEIGIANLEGQKTQIAGKSNIKALAFTSAIGAATAGLRFFSGVIKDTAGVTLSLNKIFNEVIGTVGAITNLKSGAATYMSGSTLISNRQAREQQMRYGLSNAQNWALLQTRGALGMENEEDLMYMNSEQRAKFTTFMDKYSTWYDKMESSGVLENIQEMQLDLYMFKQELAMDFMNWFAENKESLLTTIKLLAKLTMKIVEGILWVVEGIANIVSWLPGMSSTGMLSSSMGVSTGYSDAGTTYNNARTNNINVTMTNNATGVLSSQDALQEFYAQQNEAMVKRIAAEIE